MEGWLSFLAHCVLYVLCCSTQTDASPNMESDVMSNKLVSHIAQVKNIGAPMNMFCNLNPHSMEEMMYCRWTRPNGGEEFVVKEGGEFVDNISGINIDKSNPNSCNITVQATKDTDLGVWSCHVELENVKQFQESRLTATTDGLINDIRLPRHLIPDEYTIQLTPFILENNFTINGHVEIVLNVIDLPDLGISNITLNIREIDIIENSVMVDGYDVTGHGYDSSREFYIVYVKRKIKKETTQEPSAEETMTISMDFVSYLNDNLKGFYRSSYNDADGIKRYLGVTQFEAIDARESMPCMDEPNMKAKFLIQLGHTPDMKVISNMPIKESGALDANDNGYVFDIFEETKKMSTYLLAFVVADFDYREGVNTENNVTFRIWSRPEIIPQTKYAAETGPLILKYYEDYFDVKFPLPKQDMIALPDFAAGAMENWGLITYREECLLYEEGVSSLMNKESVASVMAHELAHQWFGDLVTMDWWTE